MSTTTSTAKSSAFSDYNEKTGSDRTELTTTCTSCHVSVDSRKFANTDKFKLKPGEFLHDFEGSTASKQSLASFIHHLCASNVYRMFFSYTQVLQNDVHKCSTTYNKLSQHNRFSDIPCIEETRVHVKHPVEDHDYIHANWVDGYREPKKFIVTQAPLPSSIDQFWRMIWQEKSLIVVSMIQTVDIPGAEWSGSYTPKPGETTIHDKITLQHCGTRRIRDTYDATLIKASCEGSERVLLHLCFIAWGHRATPKKPSEVLNFITDINFNRELLIKNAIAAQWLKQGESSPITIHCLSGTTRSATIVSLDITLKKLDDTAARSCGPMVDVDDVLLRLRTQRAMAIQKPESFLFLHLAAFEYAVRQRYISEKTYNEIELDNYFYNPPQASSETEELPKKS